MPRLLFLQDVINHLLDVSDLSNTTSDKRRALRSAVWGYEQATTRHQWEFFWTNETFKLNAQRTPEAGESWIISDATDPPQLAIVAGSVPSWCEEGAIVYGDEMYELGSQVTSAIVEVPNWPHAGASQDVTSAARLVHNRHLMDSEPRQVFDLWNETEDCSITMTPQQSFRDQTRWQVESGGIPQIATIRNKIIDGMSRYELIVAPFAETETVLDIAFIRRPSQPRWNWSTGPLTGSSSTLTIGKAVPRSSNANFTGSWIRIAEAAGDAGTEIDYGVIEQPEVEYEFPIVSATGTTIVIDGAVVGTLVAPGGTVTDALDIPEFLYNAVLMYAESHMARIGHGNMKESMEKMAIADDELRTAMEQGPITNPRWRGYRYRVGYVNSPDYIVES